MRPPVLLAYVLIAVGAYYFGSSRNSEQIAVKDERIHFLNDQIAAYKDRLQGATPDQAAKQIALLQEGLNEYEKKFQSLFPDQPRKLTDQQKEILSSKKQELLAFGAPIIIYSSFFGDAVDYGESFADFFTAQNIPFLGGGYAPCKSAERGVLVGLKTPAAPSDKAKNFIKILDNAGFAPKTTVWLAPPDQGLDFDLFICPAY